ncbi:Protein of unknown function [Bacillus sp. OV166]|uniref:DUF2750 domain-containing protein n=1 Tax=Bacillus sp. OV166 TaxID=1882763 RepID=UPI000A2AAA23|nr:DUF2750 domain-containing protein [Bacillus sp. OV166]SMQ80986.1 Protein of unknown function [Bacillus sp. OV166]
MKFDLTINSKRRYENFIKSVSESKTVWGLKSEDGWCVYESNDNKDGVAAAVCFFAVCANG